MAVTVSYPGVYLNRKAAQATASTAVSSSGFGLLGATPRGPVDVATLCTSWAEWERTFGSFDDDLRLPLAAWIFFQNGGSRLWTVRRTADDAVKSSLNIVSVVDDEASGITGDGSDTTHTMTTDHPYVLAGTFVLTYRPQTAVTDEDVGTGNGVTAVFNVTLAHAPLTTGSILIEWTSGAAAKSQTIAAGATVATAGGHGTPAGTSINRTTGALIINTTGAVPDNATDILVTYTYYAAAVTITDDGAGALAGGGTGTINYTTGAVSITFTSAPGIGNTPTVDYTYRHFNLEMLYPGVYGNDYRIRLYGTPGYESDATATFSRWTLVLQVLNADTSLYEDVEVFAGLEMDDSTSSDFFTTIINDEEVGSLYMVATTLATGTPSTLSGTLVEDEVLDSGDGSETEYTVTLAEDTLHPSTLTITTTKESDSSVMTVTDDMNGNLEGDVNASGTNTVDYDTGELTVTFEAAVEDGEDILATYYSAATYDSDSPYTVTMASGADGTALVASDLLATTLEPDGLGVYAFNKVAEMLMVAVPDFVGVKATDQLLIDYCSGREDRFALVCPPVGSTVTAAKNYKTQLARNTISAAAAYAPWILLKNPDTKRIVTVPPQAHVAGIIARTDATKNPAKAPAGVTDGALKQVYQLETDFSQADVGILRAAQVNALVNWSTTQGPVVFGANTLEVGGEYGYVHLERMAQFIWLNLEALLYLHVFDPNTPSLRTQITLEVTSFMQKLYDAGWFGGNTAAEGFQVICDDSNNTATTIAAGKLNVDVSFLPTTPAEFIILNLSQIQQS
jgi:phage tail sheath protein FI